jgi:predicted protein tyrosine phosphatase
MSALRGPFEPLPDAIVTGLYLGSMEEALNKDGLKHLGISHILCVAMGGRAAFPEEFEYKLIELVDSEEENLEKHIDDCNAFISQGRAKGGVLVHCAAGISRSASITIAYVMQELKMSYEEAFKYVYDRHWIMPNSGFVRQLKSYEKRLAKASQIRQEEEQNQIKDN